MGGGVPRLRELSEHLKFENVGAGFDITQRCQVNCPTCFYLKNENFPPDMSFEDFRRTVNQLVENRFRELYLLGGEPSLHPRILDFVDYATNIRVFKPVVFVTNGLRLTDKKFCKRIADSGAIVCTQRHVVGYDERKERVQDTVMGVKGTLKTINKAFENIEKYFDPSKVAVQCCITKSVVENGDIFDVFKYARERGYIPMMEFTKEGQIFKRGCALDVPREQVLELFKKFQEFDREYYPELTAKFLSPQIYGGTCRLPYTGIHIKVNGDVIPCVGHQYVAFGNVFEGVLYNIDGTIQEKGVSLKEILEHPLKKAFRDQRNLIYGYCKDKCEYAEPCAGGCRGSTYDITGCHVASFPYCPNIPKEINIRDIIPSSCDGCSFERNPTCSLDEGKVIQNLKRIGYSLY
jgi:radical SAM protein with 4Fe4S-binding SPASM domain